MEVIKEVINQSFGKLRIDPEQGRMGQNFEGVKNDLFVERERDCFYLSVSKQIRHSTLAFFVPTGHLPQGDNLIYDTENPPRICGTDFIFSKFMISDPNIRLPYKDDNDDSPYTVNSKKEESLADEVDASKEQA